MMAMAMQMDGAHRQDAAADRIPLWERVLVVYCMFHFSEGLWTTLFTDPTQIEGSPLMRMAWYPIYFLGLLGCVRAGAKSRQAFLSSGFHIALLVLAFLSSLWSVVGDVTFRRAFALFMTSLFGIYMASRFDWKNLICMFAAGFSLMAVAGFIASAGWPALFVDQDVHKGAWKGVWTEKNGMGAFMARGAVVCLCAAIAMPDKKWIWRGFAGLCAVMVLLSTSKTSLMALILGVSIVTVVSQMRKGPAAAFAFGYAILALLLGFGAMLLFTPDAFFAMLGRDPSLTGRTDIWTFVEHSISERPLLGHGYAAFWFDVRGPALYIRQALQWEVPNAHNGWLEIALGMGWLGVTFAVGLVSMIVWRARGRVNDPIAGPFAIAIVALGLLFSLSESAIAQQNNLHWMLLIAVGSKLAVDAQNARQAAAPAPKLGRPRTPGRRSASVG